MEVDLKLSLSTVLLYVWNQRSLETVANKQNFVNVKSYLQCGMHIRHDCLQTNSVDVHYKNFETASGENSSMEHYKGLHLGNERKMFT